MSTDASSSSAAADLPVEGLGGDEDSKAFPYHPLVTDIEGSGLIATVDRCVERVSGWLNPILIKEARQSLKSRQFIITFFLLLVASVVWTILGVVTNAPDVYFVPTGENLLAGYYLILAIPMMGMVPLAAFRSLAAEIEDDTFEMLVITRLSSTGIVVGKMNSAMLQMMIYFAAIVPCLAFSYLLRGVNLPTIIMTITIVFVSATTLTAFALMLATLAPSRAAQTITLLVLIGVIFFAELICAAFCLDEVLSENLGVDPFGIMMTSVFSVICASCIVVFLKAAAARIAPVTENRSTGLRWCMIGQQLLWMASMIVVAVVGEDGDVLNFGTMVIGGYWLVMGTIMLAESPELSPRVQRGLPSTLAGRTFLTWLNPGPGTGFVFAVASGTVGAFVFAVFANFVDTSREPRTNTAVFAFLIVGYLLGYLGIIRLIAMPLCHRFGRILPIPLGVAVAVLMVFALLPTIIYVATTGSPAYSYTPLESIDWSWSIVEAFEKSYTPSLALMIFMIGASISVLNLALLFREFDYRKITVPQRVLQDRKAAVATLTKSGD